MQIFEHFSIPHHLLAEQAIHSSYILGVVFLSVTEIGPPTKGAMNRGFVAEGISSFIGSMWGHNVSSNIVNSGLLSVTGVCFQIFCFFL